MKNHLATVSANRRSNLCISKKENENLSTVHAGIRRLVLRVTSDEDANVLNFWFKFLIFEHVFIKIRRQNIQVTVINLMNVIKLQYTGIKCSKIDRRKSSRIIVDRIKARADWVRENIIENWHFRLGRPIKRKNVNGYYYYKFQN